MSKLRVNSFAVSIDGYGAGPNQDLQNPIGVGGLALMNWVFHTRTCQHMQGNEDGETDLPSLGYECVKQLPGVRATHLFFRKRV